MIEADLGRATALAVARLYVVFRIRPGGQRQYSSELAAQAIRDDRLSKLAERIAQQPDQDWRTPTLAIEAGMSVRSLSRLFRKELNLDGGVRVQKVLPCPINAHALNELGRTHGPLPSSGGTT
jgi:transcriptional regulator GlxA family with amidase domain